MKSYEERKAEELKRDKQFLIDNIDLLDSYQLRDVVLKARNEKFQKETDIFLSDELKKFVNDSSLSYEKMKSFLIEKIEEDFTLDEFRTITNIHHAINWYSFRKVDDKNKYSYRGMNYAALYQLLNFVINDYVEDTLATANKIDDKYKNDTSKCSAVVISELNNIIFRPYMNGNIQIKGLTDDQETKLNKYTALIEKAKRLRLI